MSGADRKLRALAQGDSDPLLLANIQHFIQRYVSMYEDAAVAVSLWVLHCHAFEAAEATPYLWVRSAEKGSGKTRLLEVLELLVPKPWFTAKVTPAVLARKIDKEKPTLLLDEIDAQLKSGEDISHALRGALNSGYREGGKHTVCVPPKYDARDFKTFCPKAIAGIGRTLPDTVADRSITIELKRRTAAEPVERFRRRKVKDEATTLQRRAAAWAAAEMDALRRAEPDLPELSSDRAEDIWEPLLAIADEIGALWPSRARQAARALSGADTRDDDSMGVTLLRDCREALGNDERLHTEVLLARLHRMDESPWATWHHGKPLFPRALGQILRNFGIRSKQLKVEDRNRNGYSRADFADAWLRYLDVDSTDSTNQRNQGFSPHSKALPSTNGRGAGIDGKPHEINAVEAVGPEEPYPYTNAEKELLPLAAEDCEFFADESWPTEEWGRA